MSNTQIHKCTEKPENTQRNHLKHFLKSQRHKNELLQYPVMEVLYDGRRSDSFYHQLYLIAFYKKANFHGNISSRVKFKYKKKIHKKIYVFKKTGTMGQNEKMPQRYFNHGSPG
jgi:hypothetical protein